MHGFDEEMRIAEADPMKAIEARAAVPPSPG
jgi:hypothetical protein